MRVVTATFPSPDEARKAAVDLERHGVGEITLADEPGVPAPAGDDRPEVRVADGDMAGDVIRRVIPGVALGAMFGAALMIAMVLLTGPSDVGTALPAAGVGGFLLGGAAGFFYGGTRRLPVDEAAFRTYEVSNGAITLRVHCADDDRAADRVRKIVTAHHATAVK